MANDYLNIQFEKRFGGRKTVSREELYRFYKDFEPDLKEATFRWRIHHLKEKDILTPISKRLFHIGHKPVYKPPLSDFEHQLYQTIDKQFRELPICIWSTGLLNEFMLHQPDNLITILEVEPIALEPVFHFLKDNNRRNVFLLPSEKEMAYYVFEADDAIVLRRLVSKAPVQKNHKATVPTLEKIIVDIYCDKEVYTVFQGSEFIHIVNYAFRHYAVDFTRLFSYARRRRKDVELKAYLSAATDIPKNILND